VGALQIPTPAANLALPRRASSALSAIARDARSTSGRLRPGGRTLGTGRQLGDRAGQLAHFLAPGDDRLGGRIGDARVLEGVTGRTLRSGYDTHMRRAVLGFLTLALLAAPSAAAGAPQELPAAAVERFARLALTCVHQEYPTKIAHVLNGDDDVAPARTLTPAFYGCYDWHSSVHGHWLLARLARLYPDAPFAADARRALARSLTPQNIAGELRYLQGKGRASFERPYGLAWLLQLATELREWPGDEPRAWSAALEPLEREAAAHLGTWLPKLSEPIRSGEHSQTAFALGLTLDWARATHDRVMEELIYARSVAFHLRDRDCPIGYEPSGEDFLSPCLAEADLMRRILVPDQYADWLGRFLPRIPKTESATWLSPGIVTDPSDPKLAHLDGLNLSRAFMLEGIAAGLPVKDRRRAGLLAAAAQHREQGLKSVTGEHYEGGHWLGTFAVYLVTGRGLPAR